MTQTPATDKPRLSGQALAGLLFGLAPVTGPLALYFGYRGLYAVNASNGRLLGRRLAIVGMALGAVGTVLLVVGSVALLLIQLRSTSERVECMNNLRVIGMAVTQYEENNGVFPQAVMPLYGEPLERHASWLAGVLPYLDAGAGGQKRWQTLAGQLDLTKPWDDSANSAALTTYVPYFQCRGDPAFDPRGRPGVTNYVGVAGVGENAAELPKVNPRAGFFGYNSTPGPAQLIAQTLGAQGLTPAGAPMGSLVQAVAAAKVAESLNRTLTLADLKRRIDTSDKSKATSTGYKMMVVETTDRVGPWIAGGPPTVRGVGFDPTFLTEQGASVVGLSQPGGDYFAAGALLAPRPPEPSLIGPGRPFGGLHAGGMNVLWIDGSVRFVPDSMSPRTFRMQATLCNYPAEPADLP